MIGGNIDILKPAAYSDPSSHFTIDRINQSPEPFIQRGDLVTFTSKESGKNLGEFLTPLTRPLDDTSLITITLNYKHKTFELI